MTQEQQSAASEGRQAWSSVEVTKNTRGYSWSAKVYVPAGEEDTALPKVQRLELALREMYGAEE
jgi:hypothetical protein